MMRRRYKEIKRTKLLLALLCFLALVFAGCSLICPGDEDRIPMNVEYDYQYDIGWMDNCDVFPNGEGRMDSSFSKAKTDVFIWPDEISLVPNTPPSWFDLIGFCRDHYVYNWQNGDSIGPLEPMYLVGIMDQDPRDTAHIDKDALAITFPSGMGGGLGTAYGGVTVIFSCYIKIVAGDTWGWDKETIEHAFEEIVIHELGHQRADLSHYDPQHPGHHTPGSECVMAAGIRDENGGLLGWYDFCDSCVSRIEQKLWKEGKREVQSVKQ